MGKDNQRAKRLQKAGIETNEMTDRQFIADKNVSSCIREVQLLMDKWNLRPLERDIFIMLLGKYEKDREITKKQTDFMDKNIGGLLGSLGMK